MAVATVLSIWATFVIVLAVVWNIYRNVSLFSIMYFLYTKTPVGPWFHKRALAKSRGKAPHSKSVDTDCGTFTVRSVAYLSDNFAYFIHDHATNKVAVVDPADPARVLEEFAQMCKDKEMTDASLTAILTTHHHMDHAGGNVSLKASLPAIKVYGGIKDRVAGATVACNDGDKISIGQTTIQVISTPCHTRGHVMFYVGGKTRTAPSALFSGDMIFVAGCGKFFEGAGEQMAEAIARLQRLPKRTHLFSGHEYTLNNSDFAQWVEPGNEALQALRKRATECRAERLPVSSTLGQEREYNPYFRLDHPDVRQRCGVHSSGPASVVASVLRSMKDRNVHKQSHAVTERPLFK